MASAAGQRTAAAAAAAASDFSVVHTVGPMSRHIMDPTAKVDDDGDYIDIGGSGTATGPIYMDTTTAPSRGSGSGADTDSGGDDEDDGADGSEADDDDDGGDGGDGTTALRCPLLGRRFMYSHLVHPPDKYVNDQEVKRCDVERMKREARFREVPGYGRADESKLYCYLCEIQLDKKLGGKNTIKENIELYMSDIDKKDPYYIVLQMHDLHQQHIAQSTRKVWTTTSILNHIFFHRLSPLTITAQSVRNHQQLSHEQMRWIRMDNGPPDTKQVKAWLDTEKQLLMLTKRLEAIQKK